MPGKPAALLTTRKLRSACDLQPGPFLVRDQPGTGIATFDVATKVGTLAADQAFGIFVLAKLQVGLELGHLFLRGLRAHHGVGVERDVGVQRFADRLAVIGGFGVGQQCRVGFEAVGDLEQDVEARRGVERQFDVFGGGTGGLGVKCEKLLDETFPDERSIDRQHLPDDLLAALVAVPEKRPFLAVDRDRRNLDEISRQAIQTALENTRGNLSAAARQLGISRQTLYRKLKPRE